MQASPERDRPFLALSPRRARVHSMDLRDYFAAHVAAALAHRAPFIALMAWGDELPPEAFMDDDDARGYARSGLLDEPAPISERDLDLSYVEHDAPSDWEAKPIIDVRPGERPGLARTTAATTDDGKLKKSG